MGPCVEVRCTFVSLLAVLSRRSFCCANTLMKLLEKNVNLGFVKLQILDVKNNTYVSLFKQ